MRYRHQTNFTSTSTNTYTIAHTTVSQVENPANVPLGCWLSEWFWVCLHSVVFQSTVRWYIVPVPSRWEKIPLLSIPESELNDRHWKSIFKCLLKRYHHCHRLFSINGQQSIAQMSRGIFGPFIIFQAQANGLYCSFEISQMLIFRFQRRFFSNILYNWFEDALNGICWEEFHFVCIGKQRNSSDSFCDLIEEFTN